ncbi:Acyl transferase 9, partial [Bienertia sinuspersici]
TVTVYPSNPPFSHQLTLPLSYLDTVLNLNVTFRYIRVYTNPDRLGPYYPLTGTLQPSHDGRFELHCTPRSGFHVIRATVDQTLESLDYLDDPDEVQSEKLVPNPGHAQAMEQPMILQITLFKCGGYVLGSVVQRCCVMVWEPPSFSLRWPTWLVARLDYQSIPCGTELVCSVHGTHLELSFPSKSL